ncbi:MAG: hypothetical protein Q8Q81_00460 [Oxalobacteraceae bacterium]|nr:hypothetical protein [Oxalobacteraceae bacterium]
MHANTLHVKAAPGLRLPKEGNPHTYITDAEPVEVEACHYYRKAISDGDLVALTDDAWAAHLAARSKAEAAAVKAGQFPSK